MINPSDLQRIAGLVGRIDALLLDTAERLETIQAVREGLASVKRGEGRPMDDVFDEIEAELLAKAGA